MSNVVKMPSGTQKGLKVETLGQLLNRDFPPRGMVVGPWLRTGESAMVWAPTGLGKTMLTLTMALVVAGGGQVAGWEVTEPRRVLLVDGEMHLEDLRDRLKMLVETVEGIDIEAASENLRILCRQGQKAEVAFPDLAEKAAPDARKTAGQDVILKEIQVTNAELVILDNFSTLAEVADENEAGAMNPVLTFLLKLKQRGTAAILVHHSGKTEGSYRGSSKLATTFEVIIGLYRLTGDPAATDAAFELRWTKFRGRRTQATMDAEMRLEEVDGGKQWTTKPTARTAAWAAVEAVRSCKYKRQEDIAKHLDMSEATVSRLKAQALADGMITEAEWTACMKVAREGRTAGLEDEHSDF